jgi:glycosyltransferase involved in cell wall biosynthesis
VFIATKLYIFHNWKIIFHDHYGLIEIDNRSPWWFSFVGKRISHYIGVSTKLTKWAVDHVGIPKKFCSTLPNIRVLPNDAPIKTEEKSSSNIIKLVHVANIHRIKNIEFSINLLKYLQKEYLAELTIYGQIADKVYSEELHKQIRELGLGKTVRFVMDETNIPSVLTSYDIGICSSKFESGPLIVIEYMHSGLPFVSINRGEVIKRVNDYYPEFIIDNYEISEWIYAIKNILKKDTNKLSISLNTTYQNLFKPDQYVNRLLEVYSKVYTNK